MTNYGIGAPERTGDDVNVADLAMLQFFELVKSA